MKLELVDGYLGYLLAKYQLCPWSRRLNYSKHVARKLGAGQSPLGVLCNVTPSPLYRVATWDVATRYKNDTAPYKELSQKGIL